MSIGGSMRRWEPGMTRSRLLSRVKGVTHHMAASTCHGLSARRSPKSGWRPCPRGDRLAHEFFQTVPDRGEHGQVQQRPHDQVTLLLKKPALARLERPYGGHS